MKIYTFLSEAQREMYENYFLSSLPSEFEICTTFHNDPYVEPTGDYYSLGLPCPEFTERMKTKALFMKKVCKENLGNTIVFADADLQFFGPLKKTLIEELGDLDMACQQDDTWNVSRSLCGGLMVCRCNENTLNLFTKMEQHFRIDDQITLNDQKDTCKHKVLPMEKFFTVGHVLGRRWWKEVNFSIPKHILVHHASWTLGIENKIKLLEIVRKRVHNRK
jgi:hypothetical protein